MSNRALLVAFDGVLGGTGTIAESFSKISLGVITSCAGNLSIRANRCGRSWVLSPFAARVPYILEIRAGL